MNSEIKSKLQVALAFIITVTSTNCAENKKDVHMKEKSIKQKDNENKEDIIRADAIQARNKKLIERKFSELPEDEQVKQYLHALEKKQLKMQREILQKDSDDLRTAFRCLHEPHKFSPIVYKDKEHKTIDVENTFLLQHRFIPPIIILAVISNRIVRNKDFMSEYIQCNIQKFCKSVIEINGIGFFEKTSIFSEETIMYIVNKIIPLIIELACDQKLALMELEKPSDPDKSTQEYNKVLEYLGQSLDADYQMHTMTSAIDSKVQLPPLRDHQARLFEHTKPKSVNQMLIIKKEQDTTKEIPTDYRTPGKNPALDAHTYATLIPKELHDDKLIPLFVYNVLLSANMIADLDNNAKKFRDEGDVSVFVPGITDSESEM